MDAVEVLRLINGAQKPLCLLHVPECGYAGGLLVVVGGCWWLLVVAGGCWWVVGGCWWVAGGCWWLLVGCWWVVGGCCWWLLVVVVGGC